MPSAEAQKLIEEFEESELVSCRYDEDLIQRFSTITTIYNLQGELADAVLTRLNSSTPAPVIVTNIRKAVWKDEDQDNWEDDETFRIEAGEKSQTFKGTSYDGVVREFVEWLTTT